MDKIPATLGINIYSKENLVSPYEKQYWADVRPEECKNFIYCGIDYADSQEKMIKNIVDFLEKEYDLDSYFVDDSRVEFYSDLSKIIEPPICLHGKAVWKHKALNDKELENIVLGVHKKFMKYIEKQDKIKKTKI